MKDAAKYRVGKRTGQDRLQIKAAPNWRVVHECDDLIQVARWLTSQGIDHDTVVNVTAWPWVRFSYHNFTPDNLA